MAIASNRLPSLKGIEAFVSAAHALSFRDAAEQLHLTTSAISRRIQSLEDQVGVQLFDRNTRSVRLTSAGRHYLDLLMPAIDIIQTANRAVRKEQQEGAIRIACSSLVASQWLQPLLMRFRQRWPDVKIEVYALDPLKLSAPTETDLCIATINDGDPCQDAIHLFEMHYFPICSAELAEAVPIRSPEDLYKVPLIEIRAANDAWALWFRAAGLERFPPKGTIMIEDTSAYTEAVVQGLGVGLGSAELTGERLRRGQVKRLFDITCRYPRSVYLRANRDALQRPPVLALQEWLLADARQMPAARVLSG